MKKTKSSKPKKKAAILFKEPIVETWGGRKDCVHEWTYQGGHNEFWVCVICDALKR